MEYYFTVKICLLQGNGNNVFHSAIHAVQSINKSSIAVPVYADGISFTEIARHAISF
jgi:hypothetical protein